MLRYLPFLFIIMPVTEIAVFIMVGGQIGIIPTIAIILTTAIIGSFLLRKQGLGLLGRIQEKMNRGEMPGRDLVHGVMVLAAGLLLLTPGFVTDTIGFSLFIPGVRDKIASFIRARIVVMDGMTGQRTPDRSPTQDGVIDLDDDDYHETNGPR